MIHPRPLARCYICGKEGVPRTMLCAECEDRWGFNRRQTSPKLNARNLSLVMRLLAKQGGLCALCDRPIVDEMPTRDHIIPRSHGGTGATSNLQAAHARCNSRRGSMDIAEFKRRFGATQPNSGG